MGDPFDDLCKHGWLWDGPCVWCENERLRARIEKLERELLEEVANSGVEFEDERVGYVSVQIDRTTWEELNEWRRK